MISLVEALGEEVRLISGYPVYAGVEQLFLTVWLTCRHPGLA